MSKKDLIARGYSSRAGAGTCAKLDVYNWLQDIPNSFNNDILEVRFKNTRKDYYRNVNGLDIKVGDLVAVESSPGHDIGVVSLTGDLVLKQMKHHKITYVDGELRKVYRLAKDSDVSRWKESIALEHSTMLQARKIAEELKLDMKIGDVEFQGDRAKAIFYYIADARVDFRTLIKVYAETFRVRIEMKQIGARQEAGRIGGIGPCGRELCCCSWMTSFVSVSTSAARYQGISLNPQKLAGQCSKLKCCLNYELDCYIDAQKNFPKVTIPLYAESGRYNFQKADVFKGILWYSHVSNAPGSLVGLTVATVNAILKENKEGTKRERLESEVFINEVDDNDDLHTFDDGAGEGSLDRFDKGGKPKRSGKGRNSGKRDNGPREKRDGQAPNRKVGAKRPQRDGTQPDKGPQAKRPARKRRPNPNANPNRAKVAKAAGETSEGEKKRVNNRRPSRPNSNSKDQQERSNGKE